MKKIFLLDTNVILYDPQAIYKFEDNTVVISISVLEEIDQFKRDLNENGRNARQFSRYLDELRKKGKLSKGVRINKEGILQVDLALTERENGVPSSLAYGSQADNIILSTALRLKETRKEEVIFLTKDTNLRVKADVLGINAQDYEPNKVDIDELFSGVSQYPVPGEVIDTFYNEKKLPVTDFDLKPNEFVFLEDEANHSHTAIARYNHKQKNLVPVLKMPNGVWGVFPKNLEQTYALDLLLDDEVKLVTLVGKAGTGKTLLALAAGLLKTIDESHYQRLLVSRPIFPMGRDIGFLPGDVEEKLNPWMQPIFDNIEFLLGTGGRGKKVSYNYRELINQGMLNIEPLTYIRGRSIPNQYLIVDEAQNLTPHEIKTIITRVGENTKIILTGDCYQIDNPYIDSSTNGLTYVVERFKGETIAGHVTLIKGERSPLAELATNLL